MKTTCPLDCFDACSVIYEGDRLKGDKNHPITDGYLCPHLNNWFKHERITNTTYNQKNIPLSKGLDILEEKLKNTTPHKTLFYKGAGNLGNMQGITKLFFEKYGGVIATGNLCDGIGDAGIVKGRGANLALSPQDIKSADVVILWGRNASVTNSHVVKSLKGKTIIVINPVKIPLAKKAAVHVQIKPRRDIYFALLLAKKAHESGQIDREFIGQKTEKFDKFVELFNSFSFEYLMDKCELENLDIVEQILSILKEKRVSFLVGLGVQKYSYGANVMHVIDSFAAMIGMFGKIGCGVGFLSDSKFSLNSFTSVKTKEDSVVNVDFSKYDVVFIQGANPAVQMPDSLSVRKNLQKCKFVVYFGLHENKTSQYANLIIPASSFLAKDDIRGCYGHKYIGKMPKIINEDFAMSEYALTKTMFDRFDFDHLKSEKQYIESFANQCGLEDGYLYNKTYDKIPYEDGFYTKSGKFQFCDYLNDSFNEPEKGYFLISQKNLKSLNSQFYTNDFLHVPPSLNLNDGDEVLLKNKNKECKYKIKTDKALRDDTLLLFSGGANSNALTPPTISDEGHGPIYSELKVSLETNLQ